MNKYTKRLIGLNRYQKEFKTQEELNQFIEKNKHKYSIQEILINNSYGVEFKVLKQI